MERSIRSLDIDTDFDAVRRIWREVRWIEKSDDQADAMRLFLDGGDSEVGIADGTPECLVVRRPGTITYDDNDLSMSAVAAVTTSHIGRKLGFASTLTARAVAAGAIDGAAVAALGMFEQGFYDRFGFATASYDHRSSFDPQSLGVSHVPYRTPVRLSVDDAADMAGALRNRLRHHGGVTLDGDTWFEAELRWQENLVALGYRDGTGELTHFFAGSLENEHGPLKISLLCYRSVDELMELLRLVRELGDQVRHVVMYEPAILQMQVLLEAPMRRDDRNATNAEPAARSSYVAWWQLRICDLAACVAARRWEGEPVEFDLRLTDPITEHLEVDWSAHDDGLRDLSGWSGIGGDYTVHIGSESTVDTGHSGALPLVECDVGALTRLWFGVAPASTLVATHRFSAPPDLVASLDRAFRLPPTLAGMLF